MKLKQVVLVADRPEVAAMQNFQEEVHRLIKPLLETLDGGTIDISIHESSRDLFTQNKILIVVEANEQ